MITVLTVMMQLVRPGDTDIRWELHLLARVR